MHQLVQVFEETDGLQVLVAPVYVGQPFPFLAAVIQVKHGRHGVEAKSVHVVLGQPKEGVGHQEITDFVAAYVEDVGSPVRVLTLARVNVLV